MYPFHHMPHPVEAWGPSSNNQIHVVGGGTIEPIRNHFALTAPAYGSAARKLASLCHEILPDMETKLHLTAMAGGDRSLETSNDLRNLASKLIGNTATKVVIWSPAVTDFQGQVGDILGDLHAERLSSAEPVNLKLWPTGKILPMFRKEGVDGQPARSDIFTVGFKTTTNASAELQFAAGIKSLQQNNLSLVLANDTVTRNNMIISPDETIHHETDDRSLVLRGLVELIATRIQHNISNIA